MVHRDPQTGQFVPDDDDDFTDIEVATFAGTAGIEAANLGGGTGFTGSESPEFEGIELLDYDEVVDRNEELVLLSATHRLAAFLNSTATADGTLAAAVEVSGSPSVAGVTSVAAAPTTAGDFAVSGAPVAGRSESDDTIDLIGRPLLAVAHGPITDGPQGVGGAGSAGVDMVTTTRFPAEAGRFHPRDELFMNGRLVVWNTDDTGVHAHITGQHVYGVLT